MNCKVLWELYEYIAQLISHIYFLHHLRIKMSPILRISGEVKRKLWPYILQLTEKWEQKVVRENASTLQMRLDIKK